MTTPKTGNAIRIDGKPVVVISRNRKTNTMEVMITDLLEDPAAWGIVVADLAVHAANAHVQQGFDPVNTLRVIKEAAMAEWRNPTDRARAIPEEAAHIHVVSLPDAAPTAAGARAATIAALRATLKDLVRNGATEVQHIRADEAVCAFLRAEGYTDVADVYDAVLNRVAFA